MLPAPHSNFFDDSTTDDGTRLGGSGRLAISSMKIDTYMTCRPKKLFGPVAGYLISRIGCRWSQVLLEIDEKLGSAANLGVVMPRLSELVEFNVQRHNDRLYHGSGLLKGQPLQAGWRRRLYVCPDTGRLKRIALNDTSASIRALESTSRTP